MKIYRSYDSAGPTAEALLLQAFRLYLALQAGDAPATGPT